MKKFMAVLFIICGILGGLFVGGWILFIKPIIAACMAYDLGNLSGVIIGTTIIKCIFASPVGFIIAWLGCIIGNCILDVEYTKKFK